MNSIATVKQMCPYFDWKFSPKIPRDKIPEFIQTDQFNTPLP
jgi:hypothetical protein